MAIRGITVILYEKTEVGKDEFNRSVYEEKQVAVENVLVAPASSTDIAESMDLYGKKVVYNMAIPKSDKHNWEDTVVEFFGEKWRTFGFQVEGIEDMIPLYWNKTIKVERYG